MAVIRQSRQSSLVNLGCSISGDVKSIVDVTATIPGEKAYSTRQCHHYSESFLRGKDPVMYVRKFVDSRLHPDLQYQLKKDFQRQQSIVSDHVQAFVKIDDMEVSRPFVKGVALSQRLQESGALGAALSLTVAIQLLKAVSLIHNHNVILGTLSLDNVILNPDTGSITVVDFGVTRICDEVLRLVEKDYAYMPLFGPEGLSRKKLVMSREVDMWRLGLIFYSMISGALPFPQRHAVRMATAVGRADVQRLPSDQRLHLAVAEAMRRCLSVDPAERPTADSLLEVLERYEIPLFHSTPPEEVPADDSKEWLRRKRRMTMLGPRRLPIPHVAGSSLLLSHPEAM